MIKKFFTVLIAVALTAAFTLPLVGCAEKQTELKEINYLQENNYEYTTAESKDYLVYTPVTEFAPKYGFLFYLGTAIPANHYDYLSSALCKQGYLVMVSKNPLAYVMYKEEETAFSTYPNIKFFVGGHSQGGGATVRGTKENLDIVQGVVLLAPLAYEKDSVKDTSVPTLLIEATKDGVLTDKMKEESKRAIPINRTEYLIEGAHMSFSSHDSDVMLGLFNDGKITEEVKAEQKNLTVTYVKDFLTDTVSKIESEQQNGKH